ncbi:hypothetical protein J3369_13700, partial [Alteromonas sp. NFXS44]|uniref:hypothetical protein n=1 Tax=Alteromonas sp. NFXS44 TaxID=2818435 RepID=UPI0032E010E5
GLPPAFNLSHDQTLQLNISKNFYESSVDTLNECPHRLSCYKLLKNIRLSLAVSRLKRDAYITPHHFFVNHFLKYFLLKTLSKNSFPVLCVSSLNRGRAFYSHDPSRQPLISVKSKKAT